MTNSRREFSKMCVPDLKNARALLMVLVCAFALAFVGCEANDDGDALADAGADGSTGGTPGNGVCGADPSAVDTCSSAADCSSGEICAPTTSCVPSICSCDPATGTYTCTTDCGLPNVCQPASDQCSTPNPAKVATCEDNADCSNGNVCAPSTECVPSTCSCDPASGAWACTEDCGMPNVCQPAASLCTTPDPSQVTSCQDSSDCTGDDVCAPSTECVPSTCSCDGSSNTWTCTTDCGMPNVCQPAASQCTTPDPSQVTTCQDTSECSGDDVCAPSTECVPSSCVCDPTTGAWSCTEDCGMPNVCQPPAMACAPPFRSQLCGQTADCNSGEVCTRSHGECIPSACGCDPQTGQWTCTADCNGGLCVPSSGRCGGDSDCAMGSEWCEEDQCIPCDNSGQLCDIACQPGFELEVRNGCTPCNCVPSAP